MTDTDFLLRIFDQAWEVYDRSATGTEAQRHAGALLGFHGTAENGGLVGGGVENFLRTDTESHLRDAIAAYRWFGLDGIADLIERAEQEYHRFRPTGAEELHEEDETLWGELDERYFEIATDERLTAALQPHATDLD